MTSHSDHEQRVAVITGTSSGLGEATACAFLQAGFAVHGLSRSHGDRLGHPGFHHHPLDVTDSTAIQSVIARIVERTGRIDVLVNAAGYSLVGAVEDTSDTEVLAQIDVNLMGAWRLTRAVLPVMRTQGAGRIISIGSIGGSVGLPFQAAYSASKFALAGFTEALGVELAGTGVEAILVEPGNFDTAIGAHRRRAAGAIRESAYGERFKRTLQVIESDERKGHAPEILARAILRAATVPRPATTYRIGPVIERLAPLAKTLLPDRLFRHILVSFYR